MDVNTTTTYTVEIQLPSGTMLRVTTNNLPDAEDFMRLVNDAERYRYWRDNRGDTEISSSLLSNAAFDAAIDQARKY
jgi:hypothetical protein